MAKLLECDYKKDCVNRNKRCWNCDRNQENDFLEDNFEKK